MLRHLILVVTVARLCHCESPVDREIRMGRWPQGKWEEHTKTSFDQNHNDLPSYLNEHYGYQLPRARMGHATVMDERSKKMMMFGGGNYHNHPESAAFNDLWELDILKSEWREIKPDTDTRPIGRMYHTMFQHAHITFVFGGATFSGPEFTDGDARTATYYSDLWAFDPTIGMRGAWRHLNINGLPTARHSMSVTSWEGRFFFFGGQTINGSSAELYVYSPQLESLTTGSWTRLTPSLHKRSLVRSLPLARSAHTANFLDDGNMYVFGGQHNDSYRLDDLWKYDVRNNSWVGLKSIGCNANPQGPRGIWSPPTDVWHCGAGPSARSGHAATTVLQQGSGPGMGAMVIIGGQTGAAEYSNSVWVYERGRNRFQEHSVSCSLPVDHSDSDQRGRKRQCVEPGTAEDRVRPAGRWRFSLTAYHNRTGERAYLGTRLYMFGGAAYTFGEAMRGMKIGQATGFYNDLWTYHV